MRKYLFTNMYIIPILKALGEKLSKQVYSLLVIGFRQTFFANIPSSWITLASKFCSDSIWHVNETRT